MVYIERLRCFASTGHQDSNQRLEIQTETFREPLRAEGLLYVRTRINSNTKSPPLSHFFLVEWSQSSSCLLHEVGCSDR